MSIATTTNTLIPLSANYPYDNHIRVKSNVAKWQDGYVTYVHSSFDSNKDIATNNNTLFYLASPMNLFNIIEETPLETTFLGNYVVLSINNQYVTNINNSLWLSPVSGDDSFFRIIGNADKTFSILHSKGLYVTVSQKNPYDLTLQSQYSIDEAHHQKFNFEYVDNQIYITTLLTNEAGIGGNIEQRYWSYTKYGPESGKIRANGTVTNNDHLFNVDNFKAYFTALGLTRDHTWVNYYNTLDNSNKNQNVEINESVSALNINHLFDLPYNTKVNIINNQMDVNFANMKNVQNANYEYGLKLDTESNFSTIFNRCGSAIGLSDDNPTFDDLTDLVCGGTVPTPPSMDILEVNTDVQITQLSATTCSASPIFNMRVYAYNSVYPLDWSLNIINVDPDLVGLLHTNITSGHIIPTSGQELVLTVDAPSLTGTYSATLQFTGSSLEWSHAMDRFQSEWSHTPYYVEENIPLTLTISCTSDILCPCISGTIARNEFYSDTTDFNNLAEFNNYWSVGDTVYIRGKSALEQPILGFGIISYIEEIIYAEPRSYYMQFSSLVWDTYGLEELDFPVIMCKNRSPDMNWYSVSFSGYLSPSANHWVCEPPWPDFVGGKWPLYYVPRLSYTYDYMYTTEWLDSPTNHQRIDVFINGGWSIHFKFLGDWNPPVWATTSINITGDYTHVWGYEGVNAVVISGV